MLCPLTLYDVDVRLDQSENNTFITTLPPRFYDGVQGHFQQYFSFIVVDYSSHIQSEVLHVYNSSLSRIQSKVFNKILSINFYS